MYILKFGVLTCQTEPGVYACVLCQRRRYPKDVFGIIENVFLKNKDVITYLFSIFFFKLQRILFQEKINTI